MQFANEEVQMKAAEVQAFGMGCRLGNLEKATAIKVTDPQPDMIYPPRKIPLESMAAKRYALPIAEGELPRIKPSAHDHADYSLFLPLVDSRRRSMAAAYSKLSKRMQLMRAEGLSGIALKSQNQLGFTRYASLWNKKSFADWSAAEAAEALAGLRAFL